MEAEIEIRDARPSDAPAILDMARALAAAVEDPVPTLGPEELVRNGFGRERWFDALLAEQAGRPVGYAIFSRLFEAHTGQRRLWIGDFFVRSEARRSGVGRRLMAAIAERAVALDCGSVVWEVWRLNDAGRAFFDGISAEEECDLATLKIGRRRLQSLASNSAGDE